MSKKPENYNLGDARKRSAAGQKRVELASRKINPIWYDRALEALKKFAKQQSSAFLVESARSIIEAKAPLVGDARVWGPLSSKAIKRGILKPTHEFAPAATSNGAPKRLYIYGGGE